MENTVINTWNDRWGKTQLFMSRYTVILAALMVAAAAFLVFLPALDNAFLLWDDNELIYDNPHIRSLGAEFFKWAFLGEDSENWIPLTFFSFGVDYAMWGNDPWGYHLTNIILHSANTFLVALLAYRLVIVAKAGQRGAVGVGLDKGAIVAGAVTALLFGLHPMRVESVAWATERKDVLYAFFYLLAILAYLRYAIKDNGRVRYYFAVLGLFACSFMSKPMAVTLPAALLILDYYPLKRLSLEAGWKRARGVVLEKVPLFIMALSVSLLTASKYGGELENVAGVVLFAERLQHFARNYLIYLKKMLVPIELTPIYPNAPEVPFFSLDYAGPALLFIAITVYTLLSMKKRGYITAAWFYYVVTLLPVSSIVAFAEFVPAADRYTYLPFLGLFMLVGLLAGSAFGAGRKVWLRWLTLALVVLTSVVLSFLTINQTRIWKDSITFWTYTVAHVPDNPQAHYNLGNSLFEVGRIYEAMEEFKLATLITPGYFEPRFNLAFAYEKLGRTDEAILEYETALRIKPGHGEGHNNLANAYFKKGRMIDARREYENALAIDPDYLNARHNLAVIYHRQGLFGDAVREYLRVAHRHPDHVGTRYNLGLAYMSMGELHNAKRHFEEALRTEPGHAGARRALRDIQGR